MSPKKMLLPIACCAVATAALPMLAQAGANDYNYVEGGLIYRDNYGHSDLGGRIAASIDLPVPVAPFAEATFNDPVDQYSVGAVFHAPIRHDINWFAGGSLEHIDAGNGHDDTGFGLRAGLRWQATGKLDLTPELRYVDLNDDGQFSLRVAAAYAITPRLDLTGAIQGGEDDRFEAGIRYRFDRLF